MISENVFILFIQEHLAKEKKYCQDKNPELGTRDKSIQLKITANPTLFGTSPCP